MLAELANQAGFTVCLPWGSSSELQRAQHIASASKKSEVLPKMNLSEVASVLCHASAVVAVDTGLAHLAAALSVPCVTLYGATKPELTGTLGENQHHLCAEFICAPCLRRTCNYTKATEIKPACYQSIAPARVWHHATLLMRSTTAVTQ